MAAHRGVPGRPDAAAAIEADVLGWWRGDLGLPPYLNRSQMPQDGWTETVAADRIDLAATVAHVCELACRGSSGKAAGQWRAAGQRLLEWSASADGREWTERHGGQDRPGR